jgi:CRISPR-associated protein Cmr5
MGKGAKMGNTIAQERSAFALQEIYNLKRLLEENGHGANVGKTKDEFAKLASGLPAMILQNGFGQALAYLLAKGSDKNQFKPNDKHIHAFNIVARWLEKRGILGSAEPDRVVSLLAEADQSKYLRGQEEALKVLEWVKRYANSGLF